MSEKPKFEIKPPSTAQKPDAESESKPNQERGETPSEISETAVEEEMTGRKIHFREKRRLAKQKNIIEQKQVKLTKLVAQKI